MTDARDRAMRNASERRASEDHQRMQVQVQLVRDGDDWCHEWVPAVYVVCGLCDGRGQHVNPSIDAHGLTAEDFDMDPDFAEDYRSGAYDMVCAQCDGRRVELVPDVERMDDATVHAYNRACEERWAFEREQEAERRFGY